MLVYTLIDFSDTFNRSVAPLIVATNNPVMALRLMMRDADIYVRYQEDGCAWRGTTVTCLHIEARTFADGIDAKAFAKKYKNFVAAWLSDEPK